MLKPAILYKEQIALNMQHYYYTTDMMYYSGQYNTIPNIKDEPPFTERQFAIVDDNDETKLIGFLSYFFDPYVSKAYSFGLFSFDRGNITVGRDVFNEMERLLTEQKIHKLEWNMIGGNPAHKGYDAFCKRHNGVKHIIRDAMKDIDGNYRDEIIYEVFNEVNDESSNANNKDNNNNNNDELAINKDELLRQLQKHNEKN